MCISMTPWKYFSIGYSYLGSLDGKEMIGLFKKWIKITTLSTTDIFLPNDNVATDISAPNVHDTTDKRLSSRKNYK
jgi:hypothetical protein